MVPAADQLLHGDRLVGGPRGLPVLTILEHFRERVQEAPCRLLLELRMLGLPPLLDHIRQQARPDDPAFVGLQDQRVRLVRRQFRIPEPFNPLRLGLLVLSQSRDGRRNRFIEARLAEASVLPRDDHFRSESKVVANRFHWGPRTRRAGVPAVRGRHAAGHAPGGGRNTSGESAGRSSLTT
jgi:hypothetical protein